MSFLLAHPFLVVGAIFLICLVIVGWVLKYDVESVGPDHPDFDKGPKVVYDQFDVDPGDGFQGSEAQNSGHGAHYDRWGS